MEMNQTEFAHFLGVSIGTYNQWELHKREPSLEHAWQIAKNLKCTVNDLFEEVEP
jgi:DNA-binding XRE family transcriptional regulator